MRHDLLRLGRAAGLLFILLLSPRLEGAAASTAEDDAAWARFTTENSDLPHERVTALLVARDGALWIGTGRGAARFARGRWEVFTRADNRLPDDEITALAQTRDDRRRSASRRPL